MDSEFNAQIFIILQPWKVTRKWIMLKCNINPHIETTHFHFAINMLKNIQIVIFWVVTLCSIYDDTYTSYECASFIFKGQIERTRIVR
jgi:hypothetical protein